MRVYTNLVCPSLHPYSSNDWPQYWTRRFDYVARRVEHWNIPTETAKRAASVIAAQFSNNDKFEALIQKQFKPVPSFWSDQYDVHLLAFGSLGLADKATLVAGEAGGECVYEYHRGGQLVGACGIGMRSVVQSYRAKFI
jgi:hypothetical protein